MPRNADSLKLKLCVVTWKLRGPEFPRVGSYVSDFDTSLISRKCDWEGCNLGIRLNINLCNKPLLFCLMVRQKDVYTCILFFTECTCKRRCVKRRPLLCFLGRYQNRHLWKKTIAYWTGVKQMFYKISALFCLLVWYHRWWRQKEGAWLNKTYWPIKYNKIYDIIYIWKKTAFGQKNLWHVLTSPTSKKNMHHRTT